MAGAVMRAVAVAATLALRAHGLSPISRRGALAAPVVSILGGAAPAVAAAGAPQLFEDRTIGLRFAYPAGWTCKGTGPFETLLAGRRVTTCTAPGGASVLVQSRVVPANEEYRDLEKSISAAEVVDFTVPDGAESSVTVRQFGGNKGYFIESSMQDERRLDVFAVNAGDAGQFWSVTLTANAPAPVWERYKPAFDALFESCEFLAPNKG